MSSSPSLQFYVSAVNLIFSFIVIASMTVADSSIVRPQEIERNIKDLKRKVI